MTSPLAASRPGREAFFQENRALLSKLAKEGQSPEILFVGCCDSRVPAEYLLGAGPGEVFVVRTVANIVPPVRFAEGAVGAALDFGVAALGIKHLIVCGHTDCGGIHALTQPPATLSTEVSRWLHYARPVVDRVSALSGVEDTHVAHVCENVLLQLEHAREYPSVSRALAESEIELHGWVFDIGRQRILEYDPDRGRFVPDGE